MTLLSRARSLDLPLRHFRGRRVRLLVDVPSRDFWTNRPHPAGSVGSVGWCGRKYVEFHRFASSRSVRVRAEDLELLP